MYTMSTEAIFSLAFVLVIFLIVKKLEKKEEEKQRNIQDSIHIMPSKDAEKILTEGGIPRRTEPRRSHNVPELVDTPKESITVRKAPAASYPTVDEIRARGEKIARQPLTEPVFDPYLSLIALFDHVSRELERDLILSPNNCVLCRKPTVPDDSRVTLTNGAHVHKTCYEAMCKKVKSLTPDEIFPDAKAEDEALFERIMMVNDYWPTYPDDWESRKHIILENADHECESCGEDGKPLHVHHIKELSAGGSNRLDNLICLCEDCHNEVHNGLLAKGIDIRKGKNRTKIDDAINRDRNIEFTYKDTKGNYTRRTAKPLRYVKTPHGAAAVRAFCYLRNEERTFVIRKMSKMKVL